MQSNGFVQWLDEELAQRNWRQADLARAAGISTGALSHIYSGARSIGPDVANAIAKGLNLPPDFVFRQAGLLPEIPGPDRDPTLTEIIEVMRNLPPDERREVLDYALFRYKRNNENG